jgi:hypothetical protein
MNATECIIECGLTRGRLTATQLFLAEVQKAMDPTPKHGRAHTVPRVWMVWHGDKKVPYKSYLHYAPQIGYWVCLKDNHGNLVFNSDAYVLASTCRMVLMEKLYEIRGEVNQ